MTTLPTNEWQNNEIKHFDSHKRYIFKIKHTTIPDKLPIENRLSGKMVRYALAIPRARSKKKIKVLLLAEYNIMQQINVAKEIMATHLRRTKQAHFEVSIS